MRGSSVGRWDGRGKLDRSVQSGVLGAGGCLISRRRIHLLSMLFFPTVVSTLTRRCLDKVRPSHNQTKDM